MMLSLEGVRAGHGQAQVLHDVTLSVAPGEVVCLLGRNGAGKTTLMQATMGLLPLMGGKVRLGARILSDLPAHQVPRAGLGYVPQGRRLFSGLTVAENLAVGLAARNHGPDLRDRVLDRFPRLRDRLDQQAQTLSGGEQQMLAIARALCLDPSVLLMDEPTEGLQPSMIAAIRQVVTDLAGQGVGILLVEQRIDAVLSVATRVAFMEHGHLAALHTPDEVAADRSLAARYIGI